MMNYDIYNNLSIILLYNQKASSLRKKMLFFIRESLYNIAYIS